MGNGRIIKTQKQIIQTFILKIEKSYYLNKLFIIIYCVQESSVGI